MPTESTLLPVSYTHLDVYKRQLFSVLTLRQFTGGVCGLLLAQLAIDLVFVTVIYVDSQAAITTYATYLYPILAAHGWFLRGRLAFGHAAIAGIALLLTCLLYPSRCVKETGRDDARDVRASRVRCVHRRFSDAALVRRANGAR